MVVPLRVAAYLRVSSRSQNLETQRHALTRAAENMGSPVANWFEEKVSSRDDNRPELAALRLAVRKREVGLVLVFKLDRLARSPGQLFNFVDECTHCGVKLVSVTEGFDFSNPIMGPIMIAVLGSCAHLERENQADRLQAARARLEAEGRGFGRKSALTVEQSLEVGRLLATGSSYTDCAKRFGVRKGVIQRTKKKLLDRGIENPPPIVSGPGPRKASSFRAMPRPYRKCTFDTPKKDSNQ